MGDFWACSVMKPLQACDLSMYDAEALHDKMIGGEASDQELARLKNHFRNGDWMRNLRARRVF